jgi:two-component system, NarL family, sensor histidine kinase DesK
MTDKVLASTFPSEFRPRADQIEGPRAVIASSGISLRLWRLYAQFWLICLVFPVLYLAQTRLPPARLVLAIGGLVLFVGAYTWFMWPHPASRPNGIRPGTHTPWLVFGGLILLVLVLSLANGAAFVWLLVGVSAVAGVAFTPRRAFVVVLVLTLATLGLGVALSGGLQQTDWLELVPLVLLVRGLGLDMAGLTRLSEALREIHQARGELARQAVTEERLRLARDLHDLLGHTLSLIALKSELAGRLVDTEPVHAAQEIREVEQEARRALREVRQAVAGYRQPTLRGELDGARQLLEAAGVGCSIEPAAAALPPEIDAVLAWTVREGVTNVIRHSRARHCAIRITSKLSSAAVEVINDDEAEAQPLISTNPSGTGLSGLAERVAALSGQIEAGALGLPGRRGFRLWVSVPFGGRATIGAARDP